MAIKYRATKKVYTSGGTTKENYFATVVSDKSANALDLVKIMKPETSLGSQDLLTVLELLPMAIETALASGQSVNIKGLGFFAATLTNDGVNTAEELTPDKVQISRVSFRPDPNFTKQLKQAGFEKVD